MSCCGDKRTALRGAVPADFAVSTVPAQPGRASLAQPVVFEYVGETRISAIGSVTRKLYRFAGRNAQLPVDPRDAPSIARVPNLRRRD